MRQKLLEALPGPEYEPTEAVDEGVEGDGSVSPSNRNSVSYLKKLRLMVQDNQSKAFFTCGGSITIAQPDECRELLRQSPPVALQWSSQSDTLHKTILPEDSSESTLSPFQQLVRDCTPATFGLGQKDVLDPSYRLAGKLDSDCFLTSFHPADFGILDSIEQTLLPSISSKQENNLEFRRVKAELYKLNVCTPSPPVIQFILRLAGIFRPFWVVPRACRYSALPVSIWVFGGLPPIIPSGRNTYRSTSRPVSGVCLGSPELLAHSMGGVLQRL